MKTVSHEPYLIGTNDTYRYRIVESDDPGALAPDVSGWALSWMVKRKVSDLDAAAVMVKTSGGGGITVVGTFNANPTLNAQTIHVTIDDDDADGEAPGLCTAELKRMDDGAETVLVQGPLALKLAVHRGA